MNLLFPEFVRGRGAVGLLLLRLVTGLAFILHGWPKIQNPFAWMDRNGPSGMPGILQALAAASEFGGGILLIVGFLTPLAAFLLAGTMTVAILMVHVRAGDPFVGRGGQPSWELAAGYLLDMVLLLLVGPGAYSLDALVFGRRRTWGSRLAQTFTGRG